MYQKISDDNEEWVIIDKKMDITRVLNFSAQSKQSNNGIQDIKKEISVYLLINNIFTCCGFFNLLCDKKLNL